MSLASVSARKKIIRGEEDGDSFTISVFLLVGLLVSYQGKTEKGRGRVERRSLLSERCGWKYKE